MYKPQKSSSVDECKIQAFILLKLLYFKNTASSQQGAKRFQCLPKFSNFSLEEIIQARIFIRGKHAFLVIAIEKGFESWRDLKCQLPSHKDGVIDSFSLIKNFELFKRNRKEDSYAESEINESLEKIIANQILKIMNHCYSSQQIIQILYSLEEQNILTEEIFHILSGLGINSIYFGSIILNFHQVGILNSINIAISIKAFEQLNSKDAHGLSIAFDYLCYREIASIDLFYILRQNIENAREIAVAIGTLKYNNFLEANTIGLLTKYPRDCGSLAGALVTLNKNQLYNAKFISIITKHTSTAMFLAEIVCILNRNNLTTYFDVIIDRPQLHRGLSLILSKLKENGILSELVLSNLLTFTVTQLDSLRWWCEILLAAKIFSLDNFIRLLFTPVILGSPHMIAQIYITSFAWDQIKFDSLLKISQNRFSPYNKFFKNVEDNLFVFLGINGTQRAILKATFKFIFDTICELEPAETALTTKAMQAITANKVSSEDKNLFRKYKIWNTINQARAILKHPYPHYRSESYPYVGQEKGFCMYRLTTDKIEDMNFEGYDGEKYIKLKNGRAIPHKFVVRCGTLDNYIIAKEPVGLLSLTAKEDNDAPCTTKNVIVEYIKILIQRKIIKQEKKLNNYSDAACKIQFWYRKKRLQKLPDSRFDLPLIAEDENLLAKAYKKIVMPN